MAANQANGYVLFNGAVATFDDLVGNLFVVATKTATYPMTAADALILTNQSGAITVTLPPVAGLTTGQPFAVQDISGTAQTNKVTIAVPAGINLDGVTNGTTSISVANGRVAFVFDGSGFRTVGVIGTPQKRRETIRLIQGATPGAGAQVAELVVPLGTDGAAVTWNVKRLFFRVQTAGGAPQATVEKSTGTGIFSAVTVGTVLLTTGAYEGNIVTGFGSATVASGDKLRLNATTLATAANWSVHLEIQEQ